MEPPYYIFLDEHIIVTGTIMWGKKPSVTPFTHTIHVGQSKELNGIERDGIEESAIMGLRYVFQFHQWVIEFLVSQQFCAKQKPANTNTPTIKPLKLSPIYQIL